MKKKTAGKAISLVICLVLCAALAVAINYFIVSPWNVHSLLMWVKVMLMVGGISGIVLLFALGTGSATEWGKQNGQGGKWTKQQKKSSGGVYAVLLEVLAVLLVGAFLVMVGGVVVGMQIFNSKRYAGLVEVQTVEQDIIPDYTTEGIALMDTVSAQQLGDREIGGIANFSAFDVSDDYIQLNVGDAPVKVSALEYTGFFKWWKYRGEGVPGYVTVSPVSMDAEYTEIPEGMRYVPSACFGQDLYRHIQMAYPTVMFRNLHFEVDEAGNPWYVAATYTTSIGLFDGERITGAVVVNPIDGSMTLYDQDSIPQWVDVVKDGNLICEQYDLAYKNQNGYWNGTGFGANAGCMKVTRVEGDEDEELADFGYLVKDGDVYMYTGVTSVAQDSSNLGFLVVNERTGDCSYVVASGANEQSAMNAAEGEVQQYGYQASFPSLINVDGALTYIGVLKDSSGLVKQYYTVNVEDYGTVVVNNRREDCIADYRQELGLEVQPEENTAEVEEPDGQPVTFVVAVLQYVDVEGNTYVYLGTAEGTVYRALFAENERLLFLNPGDTVMATAYGNLLREITIQPAEQVAEF